MSYMIINMDRMRVERTGIASKREADSLALELTEKSGSIHEWFLEEDWLDDDKPIDEREVM